MGVAVVSVTVTLTVTSATRAVPGAPAVLELTGVTISVGFEVGKEAGEKGKKDRYIVRAWWDAGLR